MDAVRDKRETTHTLTHKKKRYEERVSSCQQLQAAENECWNSRRGKKKKKKRERETWKNGFVVRERWKKLFGSENFFFSFKQLFAHAHKRTLTRIQKKKNKCRPLARKHKRR